MTAVVVRVKTRRVYGGTPSIIKNVKSNSARLSYNFAQTTEARAKQRVHVITGYLKSSIHREKVGDSHHRVVVGADYGVYEEYGTRYRPPHPYFRPAVRDAKAQYDRDKMKVFQG